MLAQGIAADHISYGSLLKACAVAGDAPRAEKIFVEMQQRTNHFSTFTPPSPHAYAHLMAVQRRAGDASRVLFLYDELRARKLRPALVHYSLAIRACAQDAAAPGQLDLAMRIYEDMRQAGLRLDSRGLLALTRICQASGRPDVAARLRRERYE
jgi:pentatricopeptide repeat protein